MMFCIEYFDKRGASIHPPTHRSACQVGLSQFFEAEYCIWYCDVNHAGHVFPSCVSAIHHCYVINVLCSKWAWRPPCTERHCGTGLATSHPSLQKNPDVGSFCVNARFHPTSVGWNLALMWKPPTPRNPDAICKAGIFRVNPRLHPMTVGWNLELTWTIPTCESGS